MFTNLFHTRTKRLMRSSTLRPWTTAPAPWNSTVLEAKDRPSSKVGGDSFSQDHDVVNDVWPSRHLFLHLRPGLRMVQFPRSIDERWSRLNWRQRTDLNNSWLPPSSSDRPIGDVPNGRMVSAPPQTEPLNRLSHAERHEVRRELPHCFNDSRLLSPICRRRSRLAMTLAHSSVEGVRAPVRTDDVGWCRRRNEPARRNTWEKAPIGPPSLARSGKRSAVNG